MLDILAAATTPAAPPVWISWLPIVGMIAIFWFLLIRPQMRQQKLHRERIGGLKKGDQVITAGGLVGKVLRVDDTYVDLELGTDGWLITTADADAGPTPAANELALQSDWDDFAVVAGWPAVVQGVGL